MTRNRKTYQKESDEQLVERFRNGTTDALGLLFDRYAPLVLGVCLKYLKDRDAAKDATTDIFEQLMSTLKKHEVDRFRPWLYTLSRNHCLMALRKMKTRPKMVNGHHRELEADQFSLQLKEAQEGEFLALEEAIDGLKSDQAKCIRLFYLKRMSYQQVSEQTGLDIKAVKSQIQNGKRNLKNKLKERHGLEY